MIILILALLAGILFWIAFNDWNDVLTIICFLFSAVLCGVGIAMLIVCIIVHIPMYTKSKFISYEQKYNTIMYTLKNSEDNVITLTNEISEYNSDIIAGRLRQDNIWIGILVENIYYDLDLIDLEGL